MKFALRAVVGVTVAGACFCSPGALAETQISIYGGANWNFGSDVKITRPGFVNNPGSETRSIDWDGDPFEAPPYWGVRGTYWLSRFASWGFAIDYTHQKAIAHLNFNDPAEEFSHLEFTDGNNVLLLEALYRFSPMMRGALVPYVGVGVGVTVPHVEVTFRGHDAERTFEYQCCGPAAQIMAGLEYKLDESWSLFTEAKLSYSHIDADIRGGGSLETDLWSPAVALGLTYRFGSF
ncbi:MAG: outer membrane beta-barrel protein [Hyphomicrobiaceae bacterium]|nr:outer membrane beta-barrel protein [Hyphomicrobiaceae bacterium]